MKKLIKLSLLSLLLVACSDAVVEEKNVDTVTEKAEEKKSVAQYIEEFKEFINYEGLVAETEDSSVTPVNLDGTSAPEMVLIVNDQIKRAYVATYKLKDDKWVEIGKKDYTSNTYINLSFVDKLQYESSSKADFVVGVEEAGATSVFKDLNIFMYDEDRKEVKHKVSFELGTDYNDVEVVKNNQFRFTDIEGNQIHYTFQDGQFIAKEGNRLGAIIEDELAQMVGTTINDHYLTLNDTYDSAVEKISETPDIVSNEFFGACANYSTFNFCDVGEEMKLTIFNVIPSNEVTASELEEYFGQPVIIVDSPNSPDNLGYFFAEVMTTDSMYGLQFDSNSPDAKLEQMTFAPLVQ